MNGQALRRDSIDVSRPVATSDAGSSTPRTHQGTRLPPSGGGFVKSDCGASSPQLAARCSAPVGPAEFGSIDPHAMQDDGEFAGESDLGEPHAASLGDPHRPDRAAQTNGHDA